MENIRVKEIVAFKRKSEKAKISQVESWKKRKSSNSPKTGGGNYWISCLMAISTVFKTNDLDIYDERISRLEDMIRNSEIENTKKRFQKNIDIITSFKDFDLQEIRPNAKLKTLHKVKSKSVLDLYGVPIQVNPNHVYSFSIDNEKKIGAVWFIAQKEGYSENELAMFTDILYRYLNDHYNDKYEVSKSFCVAVDIVKAHKVDYSEIESKKVTSLIDSIIKEINSIKKKK
ncbi:MAG: hypothetical protein PHI52_08430 [Bacteroidales bacterium]|nr:hypothetical protein [Bacteroidales bacterium]